MIEGRTYGEDERSEYSRKRKRKRTREGRGQKRNQDDEGDIWSEDIVKVRERKQRS